ncbi:MAG: hypothetical protein AAF216_05725 [Pseudomonadota bacterium]
MSPICDFLKGFGLGLFQWVANRVIFTVVRVGAIFAFLWLIGWQPAIFGHPYAPVFGVGLVVLGGILWRLWKAFPPQEKGDAWEKLATGEGDKP